MDDTHRQLPNGPTDDSIPGPAIGDSRPRGSDSMTIQSKEEMFERELRKLYHAELEILDLHKDLAAAAGSASVEGLFTGHKEDTVEQIDRIERMFEAIDRPPRERGSQLMEGLLAEKDEFVSEVRDDELRDLDAIGIGMMNEQFELVILDRLIILAEALEIPAAVVEDLEANRAEARAALDRMQALLEERRDDS